MILRQAVVAVMMMAPAVKWWLKVIKEAEGLNNTPASTAREKE